MPNAVNVSQDVLNASKKARSKKLMKSDVSLLFNSSISSDESSGDCDEAVPRYALTRDVYRCDFPPDMVKFGQKIPAYKLADDIKSGSSMEIKIVEIHSPFKFWFHFCKDNYVLDSLMHDIERYYTGPNPDEYQMPPQCICPGQVCAALYSNIWHRAEIISMDSNETAKVFLIDYGTVAIVNIGYIKYLANIFSEIPQQAIRGSLSQIIPIEVHWNLEATQHFWSLVREKLIFAKVSEVNEKDRIIYMILYDENTDDAIQINKDLFDKGFGKFDKEWTNWENQNNVQRKHHQREDVPTFEMLEMGDYPSYAELVKLKEIDVDYESIVDRLLFHPDRLNDREEAPDYIRNLPFTLLNSNPFCVDVFMELYATQLKLSSDVK